MDTDRSKTLELSELQVALAKVGIVMEADKLKTIFKLLNDESKCSLDLEQFMRFCYILEHADSKDPKTLLFYASDADFNGTIDSHELVKIFSRLSVTATPKQIAQIHERYGEVLTFEKFMQLFDELLK